MANDNIQTAEAQARQLALQYGLKYPVNLEELCYYLSITLRESEMEWDGCLIRGTSGRYGILVNSELPYQGRKCFTIAHEIGHHQLHIQRVAEFQCSTDELDTFRTDKKMEREADCFASELLLPTNQIRERLRKQAPSMDLILDIADHYQTSVTAAALKVTKLAPDTCALVMSQGGHYAWHVGSQGWWKHRLDIKQGKLSQNTYAGDYYNGCELIESKNMVAAQAWIIGPGASELDFIYEESLPITRMGLVLSLLTVPEPDSENIYEDVEW